MLSINSALAVIVVAKNKYWSCILLLLMLCYGSPVGRARFVYRIYVFFCSRIDKHNYHCLRLRLTSHCCFSVVLCSVVDEIRVTTTTTIIISSVRCGSIILYATISGSYTELISWRYCKILCAPTTTNLLTTIFFIVFMLLAPLKISTIDIKQ